MPLALVGYTGIQEPPDTMPLRPFAQLGLALTLVAAAAAVLPLRSDDAQPDPWPKADLLDPAALAKVLASPSSPQPKIFCVAFPVLYRQRHILHAEFAGPTAKPEGLNMLRQAVGALPKASEIVLYCGCCPMDRCPNVRPAYRMLKEMGFSKVRVLKLDTNFHTDWSSKGYPVE